jgi:hypothetical protein
MCLNTPLPPQPVVTRWGTWLEARSCIFFSKHFDLLKLFINKLKDDAVSVKECKSVLINKDLHFQLNFIHNNFARIPEAIKFLETQNLKQPTCIDKFETLLVQLKNKNWPLQNRFNQKIDAVIARNPDFTIVKQITSNAFTDDVRLLKYSDLVPYFMFAPVTSCDVERSFSKFKDILTFKRSSFTAENL